MPKISSYPTVTPTTSDLVLLADVSAANNPTKTATVSSITGVISDVAVPAADNSTGTTGQIAIGADYIYICTATNTWRRIQVTGSGW
jgi:hypothetical protein